MKPISTWTRAWVVVLCAALMQPWGAYRLAAADITPGYTFSSGEQNVTHTKLNNAASGTINTLFFSGKSSAGTDPNTAWTLLLHDTSSDAFKKGSLQATIFDHAALLNSRATKTAPVGADLLLLSDSAASGGYKGILLSNALFGAAAYTTPTNGDLIPILNVAGAAIGAISLTNLGRWMAPVAAQGANTNYMAIVATGVWTDVTNVTVTITPVSALSRFILRAALNVNIDGGTAHFRFMRGATPIALGEDLGGLRPLATKTIGDGDTASVMMEWIDAPATASAVTYKVQVLQTGGGVVFNGDNLNPNDTNSASAVSTLLVQEVRQ